MYKMQPTIKGVPQRNKTMQPDFGAGIFNLAATFNELQEVKNYLKLNANQKNKEIDDRMKAVEDKLNKIIDLDNEYKQAIGELKREAINVIKNIKIGPPGKDGESVDKEEVIESVLERIPTPEIIDEEKLAKRIIKSIPENKANLKIIQESVEIDPMAIIEKILALPDDKFKLTTKHIDGLQQTIDAIKNQVGRRGYLHGGGDTVKAGTNITITTNSNGQKVINSTGGGGNFSDEEVPVGLINGVNTTFAIANVPITGSLKVYLNGQLLSVVGGDYALSIKTITMATAPPTTSILLVDYRY